MHAAASTGSSSPGRLPRPGSAMLWGAAALLWLPQAALLAMAVQSLADGDGFAAMGLPAGGFLLLGLVRASVEAWASRRLFAQARIYVTQLRATAVRALAASSPLDAGRTLSGQAASALAEQAEAVLPWLTRYQPIRWRVLMVPPMLALVVGYFSWAAALILVLAAPLIPLFMVIIGWRAQAASQAQLAAMGRLNGFLLDRLRGMSTLRALGAVDWTAQGVRAASEALRERTMRVLRIAFLSSTALELFASLGVALVAVYVGFHLLGQLGFGVWGSPLTLGEGLFILLLAPAFFEPLRELSAVWHDRANGEAAHAALAGMGQGGLRLPGAEGEWQTPSLPDAEGRPVARRAPEVHIQGLRFGHAGATPLFHDLELHIRSGEHVALVGASGVGKTTLLSIMAGLVPVAAGTIRIGGQPLVDPHVGILRARMAWIGQQTHVFAATVSGNVTLGRGDVSAAAAARALRDAGLEAEGWVDPDAELGEGGIGLSGGELVRLALARASAAPDTDLWLVDEPTAHLDRATAQSTMTALLRLAQGRTLIVATHDPLLAERMAGVIFLQRTARGVVVTAERRAA